jgi:hypothetical protein
MRLGGPRGLHVRFREEENLYRLTGIEPEFLGSSGVPRIFFFSGGYARIFFSGVGGGSTNSVEDRGQKEWWSGGEGFHSVCKWMKPVFWLGCYGCIFHGTGNSTQLCQNFGISGWGWTPKNHPPRYATARKARTWPVHNTDNCILPPPGLGCNIITLHLGFVVFHASCRTAG